MVVWWIELQDMWLGNAEKWPQFLRHMFWEGDLKYNCRAKLAAFCYLNGVPVEILCCTLQETNKNYSFERCQQIVGLYKWWERSQVARQKYYSFDVVLGRLTRLDGTMWD